MSSRKRPAVRSVLRWWPDPHDPLAVQALWSGAGSDYELDFGDPARPPVRVPAAQTRPVAHTYPRAGRYIAVAQPIDGTTRPVTTQIVVRAVLGPQATLTRVARGRVRLDITPVPDPVRHRIDWGDGSPVQHAGAGEYAIEHVYAEAAAGRVLTLTDEPAQRTLRLNVPQFPSGRPDPVVAVHGRDGAASASVRLLFAPPADPGDFDHRTVAHTVSWGDGTPPQQVAAGTAWVDHTYADPDDGAVPSITVTDPELLAQVTVEAEPLRATWAALVRPEPDDSDPKRWRCLVRRLPTRTVTTKYVAHHAGAQIRRVGPAAEGEDFFEFTTTWRTGVSAVDIVAPGAITVATAPLSSGTLDAPTVAYDWDPARPRLILCTPWPQGPADTWFTVDWGDGTGPERLDGAALRPCLPHWYDDDAQRTLTLLPQGDAARASSCRIGPCTVQSLARDPDNRFIAHLDLAVLDAHHPVRVDWGDGTPVLRYHPASTGGRVSHTYQLMRDQAVTVSAPLQDPLRLTLPKGPSAAEIERTSR